MTPRSRRYFARKQSHRYQESMFAILMPFFDSMMMAKDTYLRLTAPRPNYSRGTPHPGGPAFIGEVGPELITMRDGTVMVTDSRLRQETHRNYLMPGTIMSGLDREAFEKDGLTSAQVVKNAIAGPLVADYTKEVDRLVLLNIIGSATRKTAKTESSAAPASGPAVP